MLSLCKIKNMKAKYENLIEFINIYIDEAHPTDGWYIGGKENIPIHKSLEDRVCASEHVANKIDDVYIDSMENNLKQFFGVQYERLYIINNNCIVYRGGQGPMHYSLEEVDDYITKSIG